MALSNRVKASKKYLDLVSSLKKYDVFLDDEGWLEAYYIDMKLNGETPEEYASSLRQTYDFFEEMDLKFGRKKRE